MPFQKGEVFLFTFFVPIREENLEHHAVILSNENMYHAEGAYLIAMITTSPDPKYDDEFSFYLSDEMFENGKNDSRVKGQVRTHLITYALESELHPKKRLNKLREIPMRKLLQHIHLMLLDE